ncbi:MAG: molybdenum ABC transporter ATP-binding protein [Gammaproteobacteria bacterium]|nr:molybdenum ABC transporter ATP-binding protein [Gammaproteobacteria bacterium]
MTVSIDLRLTRGDFTLDTAFEVPASGFTALFGPSGCGKTTLLRAIAGLEPAAQGQVLVDGECWQDSRTQLATHRRPVGYVFQQPSLFAHLDVRDNLRFGMQRRPRPERGLAFDQVVDLLGLAPLMHRRVAGLSGGECQRAAIAQALLSHPRLLLMDEPLSALDQESRSVLLPYLDEMQRQLAIPVLYVSHALDEVARLTAHMVLLREGRVVDSGELNSLLTRLDLPMSRGRNAEAVIRATVLANDDGDGLSELRFSGGVLWAPHVGAAPGERVRVRIRARDISLTLAPATGTSVLNVLEVVVSEVVDDGPAQSLVRLAAGEDTLLARVTRRSRRVLDISPGKRMYAQIKGVALGA